MTSSKITENNQDPSLPADLSFTPRSPYTEGGIHQLEEARGDHGRNDDKLQTKRDHRPSWMSATMGDKEAAAAPPAVSDDAKARARPPKTALKQPAKREDIPRMESAVKVLTHTFSERQQTCLSKDPVLGPVYNQIMGKCGQFVEKPRKLAVCSSRLLCPKEQTQLIACIRTTRDASLCHEFRDEVERCGVRMSQRMLRAALSDEWF